MVKCPEQHAIGTTVYKGIIEVTFSLRERVN